MLLKDKIPLKYVFGKIKKEMILVTIYAAAIAVFYDQLHIYRISIPISVPMIMATVLSLLLAFKSNQAYDRWWEARIIWGAIVNDSRTFARQVFTLTRVEGVDDEQEAFREKMVYRQMAWVHILGKALRGNQDISEMKRLLSPSEMQYLARYDNKPMALLELHGRDLNYALQQKWINKYQQIELDGTLTRLCTSMGQCERIKKTVFPSTYSLYIRFSLYFFILLMPLALIEYFGFVEVPLVVAIASSFLLIEKMAIHLQDPFENRPTDTPVTSISFTIERDLRQMIADASQESKVQPEKEKVYFIM